MLLFGHAGITLGVAAAATHIINKDRKKSTWLASLSRCFDIRWLLVGSLLPDIIDKPVGHFLFRDTFHNGRIFSHTLLFLILLSVAGFFLWKRYRHVWMLSLAAGTLMHLILDEMWLAPGTLFWPVFGFAFPEIELAGWVESFLSRITVPNIFVPELIGLIIVIWCGAVILKRKNVKIFIMYGKVT